MELHELPEELHELREHLASLEVGPPPTNPCAEVFGRLPARGPLRTTNYLAHEPSD